MGKNQVGRVEIAISEIEDGKRIEHIERDDDGRVLLCVSVRRDEDTLTITSDNDTPYALRLVNMLAKSSKGGLILLEGQDSIVVPDKGRSVVSVEIE